MCGIAGYTHLTKNDFPKCLTMALESIVHRGPDQHGRFVSDLISLGATRLRVIDLAGGDQPLRSPDGDVVIVFNGEIFNQHELRSELEQLGYLFATHCDTEVVLNAFLCWGTNCFAKLRGMFGLAIWIQSERRLVLARDRAGIKPLYYYRDEREVYFGSELKTLFAHPEVPRNICFPALNCYLSLNYVPGPYTLVDGVLKLMPGHFLEWRSGSVSIQSYVKTAAVSRTVSTNITTACEELEQLISESVREQLVSDVPVGIWLSGGIDSSTILHYATPAYSGVLRTFSVTFNGRSFDEGKYIREIADRYGTQHLEFDLNPAVDIVDAIEQLAYFSDEPSADAGALPLWFLARMTKHQATVVLTGEGSDELFAGYLTYRADRYASRARHIPRFLRSAALSASYLLPVSDEKISFEYKVKRFLEGSLLSPEMAHVFWNGTFSEDEKRKIFRFPDSEPLRQILATMEQSFGLQRFLNFDQQYYLPDDILYKVDRMSMAHSIEVRPPFLDPRIVDFAAQLPERFKLNGNTSKHILRQLMKDKLPPSVLTRPKIGFDIPIHDWFRNQLKPLLLDTLSEERVTASRLFRWTGVKAVIDAHMQRKANFGYHLWGLMILFMWMKRWNIEPTPTVKPSPVSFESFSEVGSSL